MHPIDWLLVGLVVMAGIVSINFLIFAIRESGRIRRKREQQNK